MLLGSKQHTANDTRRWIIDYSRWLANTIDIDTIEVTSSSTSCTVQSSEKSGDEIIFFLTGGSAGETLTVSIKMTDTDGNVKNDTIAFTVVAP